MGGKALWTQISNREASEVKHTIYLFDGMRHIAALPQILGMM